MKTAIGIFISVVLIIAIITGGVALSNQHNLRNCIGQADFFHTEYVYQFYYGCQLKINGVWYWWNYYEIDYRPGPGPST